MALYLHELAPWEKKSEYYHMIQLGKDVKEQTNIINNQTKVMVASQIASTDAIIASQERILESVDAIVCGVDKVEQGIYELKSAFEWGISEIVWHIEQNRTILKEILEVLMAPIDTQAKERRKRAEEAYVNGWIEDAEEEFLESEKLNKFDFSIHINLGMIYLFHIIDKEKSLSYFEKAIKYSKPKSAFHTSYALLYKALIYLDMDNTEEAEKASSEAIGLSPDFTEALYQNAQYNAQLQNTNKSIANLERAIRSDKLYCLKANKDKMFDPIRKNVNGLFERLRDEEKKKAQDSFAKLSEKHNTSNPIIVDISKEKFIDASSWVTKSKKLNHDLKNLNSRLSRNSYFDFLEINDNISPNIRKDQDKLISELKQKIRSKVESYEQNISGAKKVHENKIQKYLGQTGSAILYGSFLVPTIMSLVALEGWNKLWFIAFCIPLVSQFCSIFFLYIFITEYSLLINEPGTKIFGWSLALYLIGSIAYYFITRLSSKGEMEEKISKQKSFKKLAILYLKRVQDI